MVGTVSWRLFSDSACDLARDRDQLVTCYQGERDRALFIWIGIAFGLFNLGVVVWTSFAILQTWHTADEFVEHVFGSRSFLFLLLLNVVLGLLNLITTSCILVRSSLWRCGRRYPQHECKEN